jgi:TnpA family transposase
MRNATVVLQRQEKQIREHYTDTGGFTEHVFAICSVLRIRFAPRIRDLPDKRLYAPLPTKRRLLFGR